MTAQQKSLIIDESVLNVADEQRIARFIEQAAAEFDIAIALRGTELHDLAAKAAKLKFFETCNVARIGLYAWEELQDKRAHVLITDKLVSTDRLQANFSDNSSVIPSGTDAFKKFMQLHGRKIETGPCQLSIAQQVKIQENMRKDIEKLQQIYPDFKAVWERIKKARPVQRLFAEFNRHANSMDMKESAFNYFITLSLQEPDQAKTLEADRYNVFWVINHFASASKCAPLVDPALRAIERIVAKEPRRGGDELTVTC